jgi:ribosomal protein L40E
MSFKANVRLTDKLAMEVSGEDEIEIFKSISRAQEIFSFNQCGKCDSTEVRFVARQDKDENDWLEIVCQKCYAKLPFGMTKKGKKIFPKLRWDNLSETQQKERSNEEAPAKSHNGFLPNSGWYNYKKKN